MIDTVWFESESGETLRPCESLGLILVCHDAPPPPVRTYRAELDGADGELDLSEWAGGVRFGERTVTMTLRDMTGAGTDAALDFALTRRVRIFFSEQPGYFYDGRCVKAERATRRRVTDLRLTFLCAPYRLRAELTRRVLTAREGEPAGARVTVRGGTAAPTATASAPCALYVDGELIELGAGEAPRGAVVLTRGRHDIEVQGEARVTLCWRDGRL